MKLNVVQQSVLWVIWHFCKRKEFNNLPKSFSITRTTIFKVGSFSAMLSIMKNATFLWIFATKVTFFWCFFYYIFVEVWKTVSCIFILLAISTTVLKMKIKLQRDLIFHTKQIVNGEKTLVPKSIHSFSHTIAHFQRTSWDYNACWMICLILHVELKKNQMIGH